MGEGAVSCDPSFEDLCDGSGDLANSDRLVSVVMLSSNEDSGVGLGPTGLLALDFGRRKGTLSSNGDPRPREAPVLVLTDPAETMPVLSVALPVSDL